MDASRFDAWTRRRISTAAAGAIASLLGVTARDDVRARKSKKTKKKRTRKRKCEKLGTRCNPRNDKRLCCGALYCQEVSDLGGHRCCKTLYSPCSRDADCCKNLVCVGGANPDCRMKP